MRDQLNWNIHLQLGHLKRTYLDSLTQASLHRCACEDARNHTDAAYRWLRFWTQRPRISSRKTRWAKPPWFSLLRQAYDVCMKGFVPKLRPARLLDPTLFRPFHYCHTSWRDSAAAVRQELIELSAR